MTICFEASTDEYHIPETPILLRCLQRLEIQSCLVDPSEILEAITTPSLRQLYTSFWNKGLPVHSFNSFINRSNCNLEALWLSGSITGDGELATAILKYLPSSLKKLSLKPGPDLDTNPRPWLTEEVWELLKSPRNSRDAFEHCFFPNLEYFQYDGRQTFSWPDLIGTFFDSPSAVAPLSSYRLQTLDITVAQDEYLIPIDPNTLRIIQGSGFEITIMQRGMTWSSSHHGLHTR